MGDIGDDDDALLQDAKNLPDDGVLPEMPENFWLTFRDFELSDHMGPATAIQIVDLDSPPETIAERGYTAGGLPAAVMLMVSGSIPP